jgi:tetratricopeptide (TPR) repeat protein
VPSSQEPKTSPDTRSAARRPPKIWGRVPQRNKNFTGRLDLLNHLRKGMTKDVTVVLPHALHGLGGVGKTQLAIEYAYRFQGDYDVVWWVPADQPGLVRASLASLAPHLGLSTALSAGVDDAANAVLDALRCGEPYDRWLLIFDNADEPEAINGIVPRGPGHVIITSRNHRWQGVVDTLSVPVFDRAESVEFLRKRVNTEIAESDAIRLAEALGDLPLALEQAGALQAETGISVNQYLSLLEERTAELLAQNKPSDYPYPATAAWSLSVQKLHDAFPPAVDLLNCCAFFGPAPIPRDVFKAIQTEDAEQPREPALRALLANTIRLTRAIGELGRYALARVDSVSRTVEVHRLVQALLREELAPHLRDRFQHEVHLLLAAALPGDPDDPGNVGAYAELLPHFEPTELSKCPSPQARRFCRNMIRHLFRFGNSTLSRVFAEECITDWTEASDAGELDPDVLIAKRHLGDVLRELGDYRAAHDMNSRTLRQMESVFGPDNEQTLMLVNSHGADLRARGDYEAARRHDEDSLRRHRAVFPRDAQGNEHPVTLRAMNNLGIDHALLSDYATARDLLEATYTQQSSRAGGGSNADVLNAWSALARMIRLCGQFVEARDLSADAYAYGINELGADHPWTLKAAKEHSIALRRVDELDDSVELARETYQRYLRDDRRFGRNHPDTLAAAMNLANALRATGETGEALELARESIETAGEIYDGDHPYYHGVAVNYAIMLRLRGRPEEALDWNSRAFEALRRRPGMDHDFTLTCAINLASDLAALGRHAEARQYGEQSLRRLETLLTRDHPLTLTCAGNLSLDLRACGDQAKADALRTDTLERLIRAVGPHHPDTAAVQAGTRLDPDFDPPTI